MRKNKIFLKLNKNQLLRETIARSKVQKRMRYDTLKITEMIEKQSFHIFRKRIPVMFLDLGIETLDLGIETLDLGPWNRDLGPWNLDLGPCRFPTSGSSRRIRSALSPSTTVSPQLSSPLLSPPLLHSSRPFLFPSPSCLSLPPSHCE